MRSPRQVIFVDLDHTVMVNPFYGGVFPPLASQLAESAGEPDVEAVRQRLISRSLELLEERTIRANDWEAIAADVAAEIGGAWDGSVVDLVEASLEHARAVPGAREALDACRAQGWEVIAASQGFRRYQEPVLAHLGLTECFDARLYTDDVGSLKRSLRFYAKRDADAERVVVLGDQFVDDGLYPRHFGMTSVLFTGVRRTATVEWPGAPHFELAHLAELAPVLREVSADPRFAYRRYAGPRCCSCLGPSAVNAERCDLCEATGTLPPADLEPLRKRGLACVRDGRLLLCRPHQYPWLITPGGLVEEVDEPVAATLGREVREELGEGARLRAETLSSIGRFRDRAAGAPDREVDIDLWLGELDGSLRASSEIAELIWWGPDDDPDELSPVVRNAILPALRQTRLIGCSNRSTSA